jgi:thiosulfate dehydrogenase [quinone] large subunit
VDRPGLALLPLRAFLGVTFVYAGLQKLADGRFLDKHDPAGLHAQLVGYARTSPVRGLLLGASHHATLVGLAIALGELAVGLGALLGLWTRAAAVGGMLLSLSFLLGVSWHTRPYYLGPDIFSLFAWTPLVVLGDAGVFSLDAAMAIGARRELGPGAPADVVGRRTFVMRAGAAAGVGVGALALGAVVAGVGRLLGETAHASSGALSTSGGSTTVPTTTGGGTPSTSPSSTPPATSPSASRSKTTAPPATAPPATAPPGTPIGPASAVPVGGAARFVDPNTGDPAIVLQPSAGRFVAHSAVCTHAGCTVRYGGGDLLVCPCHGAEFNARSGAVLRGPAQDPLAAIQVAEGPDGRLYVT